MAFTTAVAASTSLRKEVPASVRDLQQGPICYEHYVGPSGNTAGGKVGAVVQGDNGITCEAICTDGLVIMPVKTEFNGGTVVKIFTLRCGESDTFPYSTPVTITSWSATSFVDMTIRCYCNDDPTTAAPTTREPTTTPPTTPMPAPISAAPGPTMNPPLDDPPFEDPPSEDSGCFSGDMKVDVLGKGETFMRDLQVGNKVLTSTGKYQPVYAFAFTQPDQKATFVQIKTKGTKASLLEMTKEHFVYVDGKTKPVRAGAVRVGDSLQGAEVSQVKEVERVGVYAPFTLDGTLVVNGMEVSTYAAFEKENKEDYIEILGEGIKIHMHDVAHVVMGPLRVMCMGVSSNVCHFHKEDGHLYYVALVEALWKHFNRMDLNIIFEALVVAICCSFLMFLVAMECVFGPANVPLVLFFSAVVAVGVYNNNKKKKREEIVKEQKTDSVKKLKTM